MPRKSRDSGSNHFRLKKLLLLLVLFGGTIGLLYWQWQAIVTWVIGVVTSILTTLGWGLLLMVVAVGVAIGIVAWKKQAGLIHHFNYWLAGIVFTTAIWGILAFFPGEGVLRSASLGGRVGLGIIGYSLFPAILRVAGLLVLGVFLVAPRASLRFILQSILWIGKQTVRLLRRLRRKPAEPIPLPEPVVAPHVSPALVTAPKPLFNMEQFRNRAPLPMPRVVSDTHNMPKPAEPEPQWNVIPSVPVAKPASPPPDVKQVAQDVWKKYGEAGALVTADGWSLPPIDILDKSPEVQFSPADNAKRAKLIEEALASYGVESKVVQINTGPTVTQFGLEPGWDRRTKEVKDKDKDGNVRVREEEVSRTRVKVDRITSLANDLALALAAPSIRIEAPVPGQAIVGVEVPNTTSSVVSLRGVIETAAFQKTLSKSKLALALGKGAGGEAVAADLTKMPHLLIAGATGSGKTVCLNTIISCLLLNNTTNDLRFIMIDPKRVELTSYNSIPHLAAPVIVDADKALEALRWLNQEMDKRYQKMATVGARNIEAYNKNRQGADKMPFLVLIIDELADLMMLGGDEVERILCRLAQLCRAVGIHLVVATQRPSVDVITGLIKANFPTRISFAVTSQVDSRTILDGGGAEKLLGKGDMLFMATEAGKPKRLQGCFVSDGEIERLVNFWVSQKNKKPDQTVSLKVGSLVPTAAGQKVGEPADPVMEEARKLAHEHQNLSASFLQRKLRIGYPRAARIMEQLEAESNQDVPPDQEEEQEDNPPDNNLPLT